MNRIVPAVVVFVLAANVQAQTPALPLGGAALEAWLKAGHYKQWNSESKPHDSQGPHFGRVRAYLNPVAFESMQSGAKNHPQGTATVKELYGQGDTVQGWSVAIKTAADSGGGSNWYWYEIFQNKVVKDGQGVLLCRACHLTGRDYILTLWPLQRARGNAVSAFGKTASDD